MENLVLDKYRDSNIILNKELHRYSLKDDNRAEFISVTTLIDQYFDPFNGPLIASKLVNTHPRYSHMSIDDLLSVWKQTQIHGNNVHNEIEEHILHNKELTEPKAKEAMLWLNNYIETKTIQSPRQIWWKIRPHLEYGTIEFRMLDIQRSLKNTEMFVGLLQALTYQATQDAIENNQNENLSMEYLNDGLWKAARFGLDGIITDSLTFENKYIRDHVKDMIKYCEPSFNYFNTNRIIEQILYILKNGCECDDQIKIFNKEGIESLKFFLMDNVDYSKQ